MCSACYQINSKQVTSIENLLDSKLTRRKQRLKAGIQDDDGNDVVDTGSGQLSPYGAGQFSPSGQSLRRLCSPEVSEDSESFGRSRLHVSLGAKNLPIMAYRARNDICSLARQATRLRVYVATLLGYGLEGCNHDFTVQSVEELVQRDIRTAARCGVDDPEFTVVTAAFTRVNYLLDVAEMRIR